MELALNGVEEVNYKRTPDACAPLNSLLPPAPWGTAGAHSLQQYLWQLLLLDRKCIFPFILSFLHRLIGCKLISFFSSWADAPSGKVFVPIIALFVGSFFFCCVYGQTQRFAAGKSLNIFVTTAELVKNKHPVFLAIYWQRCFSNSSSS
jgi:hypothetical protein